MGVCLWDGSRLVFVCRMRCGRDARIIRNPVMLNARFLGGQSEKHEVMCYGGVIVIFLKTLNRMASGKIGLHYTFTIHTLQLEKKLMKPSYDVMGQIDVFALLRSLLHHFTDCMDFK